MSLSIGKSDKLIDSIAFIVNESESFSSKSYVNLFNQFTKDTIKEKLEGLEDYRQQLESRSHDTTPIEIEKTQKVIDKMIWVGKKKLESPKVQLEKLLQYLIILIEKIDKNPDDKSIGACLQDLFITCDHFSDFSKNTKKELEIFLFYCCFFKKNLKLSEHKNFVKDILNKLICEVNKELQVRDTIPHPSHIKKQVFIFSGTEVCENMKSITVLQKKITGNGQSVTLIDIDTQEGIRKFSTLLMDESTKYRVFTHGGVDQPSVITPSMLYTLFNQHAKVIKKQDIILPISLVICQSAEGGDNSYARQLGRLLNDSGIHFRIKAYEGTLDVHYGSGRKFVNGKHDSHKFLFSNERGIITSHRMRKLETLNTDVSGSEDFFQLFSKPIDS